MRTALHLSIDMQRLSFHRPTDRWKQELLKNNIECLSYVLAQSNIPTLYVAFDFAGEPVLGPIQLIQNCLADLDRKSRLPANRSFQFALDIPPSAFAAIKTTFSAADATCILDYAGHMDNPLIILSGEYESQEPFSSDCRHCVTATALGFKKAGYAVTIVAEATNATIGDDCLSYRQPLTLKERRNLHEPYGVKVEPAAEIFRHLGVASSYCNLAQPSFTVRDRLLRGLARLSNR